MDESISDMKKKYVGKDEMLIINIEGPMPDGLICLCKALGCFDE